MSIHIKGPTYDGTDPASSDEKRRNDLDFVLERASTADKGKVPFLNASGYISQSVQGTKSVCIRCVPPTTATSADATNAVGIYLVPAHLDGFVLTSANGTIYDLNSASGLFTTVKVELGHNI